METATGNSSGLIRDNLLVILVLLLSACGVGPDAKGTTPDFDLARAVADMCASDCYATAHMGLVVVDLEGGQEIFSHHGGRAFLPASNQKLFTAALALARLSSGWQAVTELHQSGKVQGGVLNGDLVFRGAGDPSLGAGANPMAMFKSWGRQLFKRGIRTIAGRIVVDDRLFERERLGEGWAWDDAGFAYGAPIGPLVFHENIVRMVFSPREIGLLAELTQIPLALPVENRVYCRSGDEKKLRVRRNWRQPGLVALGCLPLQAGDRVVEVPVEDPSIFCGQALQWAIESAGIEVRKSVCRISSLAGYTYKRNKETLVAVRMSPPLRELLVEMLHRSQNLYAENLFRLAGNAGNDAGAQATVARASTAVMELMTELGIDTKGLCIHDGSGLSRLNQATPRQVAGLLAAAWKSGWGRELLALLPRAGQDGTLRGRFKGTVAEGRLRAKTGTLTRVTALSGYIPREGKKAPLAFSWFVQGYSGFTSEVRADIDNLLVDLAEGLIR